MHGKRGTWWDGCHALSSLGTAGHYQGDKWRKWPETKTLSKVEMSLSLKSPGNYKGCDYENKKNVMEITEKTEWGPRSRQHAGLWLRGGQVKGARIGRRGGGGDICMPLHCEQGGGRRVKSDSTVSNSFPCRADRARRERPGWQMTPNICVMQPLQMRDFTSQPLPFLSVYGTLPLSSHLPWLLARREEWQTFRGNYLEMAYNNHFVQSWNFPPS